MEKSRKVKIATAREIYKNAKNNGERREAQTLAEMYCTSYNPYSAGSEVGDTESSNGIQIQVKAFDGEITKETTTDLMLDLKNAFEKDASEIWVIWFNEKHYIVIEKWELFDIIEKDPLEFIRYNTRNGKKVLRLRIGMGKRKHFFNHKGLRVATKKMEI